MDPLVDGVAIGAAARTEVCAEAMPWSDVVAMVHRQMRSVVGPSRDLEDLTQSALEQVIRSASRFEGRAELSTFTYRICVHVALSHWRWYKRWLRRFELGTSGAEEPVDVSAGAPELAIERERARRLHAALDRLAPHKRVVIALADLEELPASRIAEILECPEPTVRSRLRQARMELVRALEKDALFNDEGDGE